MRKLKESLLDDEDDIVNDEAPIETLIQDWVTKTFGVTNDVTIKDNKIVAKKLYFGRNWDGTIPDYIVWHPRYTCLSCTISAPKVVSWKNFPKKFYDLMIYSEVCPEDFTTLDGNMTIGGTMKIYSPTIKNLQGLTGTINQLTIYAEATGFQEFKSNSRLKVKTLELSAPNLVNLNNAPDISMFRIASTTNIDCITGREKVTWKKLDAPKIVDMKFANPTGEKIGPNTDPAIVLLASIMDGEWGKDLFNQPLAAGDYVVGCKLNNRKPPELVFGYVKKISGRLVYLSVKGADSDEISEITIQSSNCFKLEKDYIFNKLKFK